MRQPQVEVKTESKICRSNPSVVCQNRESKREEGKERVLSKEGSRRRKMRRKRVK